MIWEVKRVSGVSPGFAFSGACVRPAQLYCARPQADFGKNRKITRRTQPFFGDVIQMSCPAAASNSAGSTIDVFPGKGYNL